ncbi:hypothetical protein V1511DRAFT_508052 [Dipodascopsis uninucleata]
MRFTRFLKYSIAAPNVQVLRQSGGSFATQKPLVRSVQAYNMTPDSELSYLFKLTAGWSFMVFGVFGWTLLVKEFSLERARRSVI